MVKKPRVKTSVEVLAHIDGLQPVRVYRNLHKDCFSVKQGGLVRCHADSVTLQNVKFIVSKAGQNGFSNWMCAYYNPYECDGFMNTATEQVYETAKFADLSNTDKVIYVFAPLTSDEIRQFKYLSPECMV